MCTQCIGLHAYHLCQVGFEGEQHFENIQASLFHSHMDCSLTLHCHIHLYIQNSSSESDKSAAVHDRRMYHIYMYIHGRALCLEYRVSWVRVPPEAAHFF